MQYYRELKVAGPQAGVVRLTDIILHQQSRILEIAFDNRKRFKLACEFAIGGSSRTRHGTGNTADRETNVGIQAIEPVENYAIKLVFSDGHDTGPYSWDYRYSPGVDHDAMWKTCLDRLDEAGASRDA